MIIEAQNGATAATRGIALGWGVTQCCRSSAIPAPFRALNG